jgi:hypothetical protein
MVRQHISPEVTVKSFKKCCTTNAMDGTDNGVLQNDSRVGMLVVSVRKIKALCMKMDITHNEDGESDTDW